jgi:tetratricopeptide (TPR) repeat protein
MLATGKFPGASCVVLSGDSITEYPVDLSPDRVATVHLPDVPLGGVSIAIGTRCNDFSDTGQQLPGGELLAGPFNSPLDVPKVEPPATADMAEKADEQLAVAELALRGRKQGLATQRGPARDYYENALAQDPECVDARRGLGILAVEAGQYEPAIAHLERGLSRDPSDGRSWYFMGISYLKTGREGEALRCAAQGARCFGTVALGHDLAGRAYMRLGELANAREAFSRGSGAAGHTLLVRYALHDPEVWDAARQRIDAAPTELLPRAVLALRNDAELQAFAYAVHDFVGEPEFELIDLGLTLADVGLYAEAVRLVHATCDSPLVQYHLAYWADRAGDQTAAREHLRAARGQHRDFEFASQPDSVAALEFAAAEQPDDALAHYNL